jgi:hypothetical protein
MKATDTLIRLLTLPREQRETWLRGSSRSGKTFALMQLAAAWLRFGSAGNIIGGTILSVVRKHKAQLTVSALRDFERVLELTGFSPSRRYDEFTYRGRMVEFMGADDETKLKSRGRDHLIVNELTELDYPEYSQLAIRTPGKIFADYNPVFGSWVQYAEPQKNVLRFTMEDNAALSSLQREAVAKQFAPGSHWYISLVEGEYAAPEGLCIPSWSTYAALPSYVEREVRPVGGIDFGSVDPTAIVITWREGDNVYAKEDFYKPTASNAVIAAHMDPATLYMADSSAPNVIHDLRTTYGLRIATARKGPDSIIAGLRKINGLNIFVHEQSHNLKRELSSYVFAKEGFKGPDHAIDALRYALDTRKTSQGLNQGPLISSNDYGRIY